MQKSQPDNFFSIRFSTPRLLVSPGAPMETPLIARLANEAELLEEALEDWPEIAKLQEIDGAILPSDACPESDWPPHIAIATTEQLAKSATRRHFLTRIYAFAELRELKEHLSRRALADFQRRHKHVLLAYDQNKMRALGSIAAGPRSIAVEAAYENYAGLFRDALSKKPTHEAWANSAEHMFGHFKALLPAPEKAEFLAALAQYRASVLPLTALLETIRLWCVRYDYRYFADQTLLEPYPRGLEELATDAS